MNPVASEPARDTAAAAAPSPRPGTGSPERLRQGQRTVKEPGNPFVPLLLALAGLLGWFAVQTWLLTDERTSLRAAHASQQQTVDNAAKLRQSLDALAADTQRMADAGNPNARLLVDELRRRGITINPSTTAAAPASTPN